MILLHIKTRSTFIVKESEKVSEIFDKLLYINAKQIT